MRMIYRKILHLSCSSLQSCYPVKIFFLFWFIQVRNCADLQTFETMKKKIFYILLILYIILSGTVISQPLEERLFVWIESNSREELMTRIDKIKLAYPNNPLPMYVVALIEQDGRQATETYKKIIQDFPKSKYAEKSTLKLAQYYFMIESFVTASRILDSFFNNYPNSQFISEAKYLSAMCLIAVGDIKKAEKELVKII